VFRARFERGTFQLQVRAVAASADIGLVVVDKLTNWMAERCFISFVSLHVHVREEDRRATASPDKSGHTLMSLTA